MAQTSRNGAEVAGASAPEAPGLKADRWAWRICWLMFGCTVLNYMDRQAIALVRPQVMEEFHIDFQTFGWVMAAFSLTYALFQVPAGYLADRSDVRRLYAGAVVWWSLAGIAAAFSPTLGVLIACRALLGMGEAFNWPCALRVTATILPPSDRGLGNGIFNSGAAIGAVLTPLVVPALTIWLGWRMSFAAVGALGFVWVLAWLGAMRGDRSHGMSMTSAGVKPGELPEVGEGKGDGPSVVAIASFAGLGALAGCVGFLGYLAYGLTAIWLGVALFMMGLLIVARLLPLIELGTRGWAHSLGQVVRRRRFWVLVVVTVSINICWHFLVGWLPTYLKEDRQLAYLVSAMRRFQTSHGIDADPAFLVSSLVTAVIFLAADAGNLLGGAASRRLAARGVAPASARWRVMSVCALLISGGAWVGVVRDDAVVVLLLALMALGAAAFMANYFAFCQEVDPARTGLIVGILGGMGNLFAAGILPFAGWVKDASGHFGPIFVLVGLSPFLGVLALAAGWGWRKAGVADPREGII